MDELKAKLIQAIMDCYGGDYEDAEGCLNDILYEMKQHDGNTVFNLISK